MKSTIRIKQNSKNAHSMNVTNSVLSQIYRSPCTKTGSQLAIGVTGYNNDSGIVVIYK